MGTQGTKRTTTVGSYARLCVSVLALMAVVSSFAVADCPPVDPSFVGLQVVGYADGQPHPQQQANLSFYGVFEYRVGPRTVIAQRMRFCVWPKDAQRIEERLRGVVGFPGGGPWGITRYQALMPIDGTGQWYPVHTLGIQGTSTGAVIGFSDANTNGEPAGDDTLAQTDITIELTTVEVLALADRITEWRAGLFCNSLARFEQ